MLPGGAYPGQTVQDNHHSFGRSNPIHSWGLQMRAQHTPAMLAVPVSLVNRFRGHWRRLTFQMLFFPANLPKTKSLFSSCTFLLQSAADKSLGFPQSNLVPPARLKVQSERGRMEMGSVGNLTSCWENSILSPRSRCEL